MVSNNPFFPNQSAAAGTGTGIAPNNPTINNSSRVTLKIFVVGNSCVGKTSFINCFVNGTKVQQNSDHYTTLGVDFYSKKMNINGIDVDTQLWDTAGQERFKSLTGTLISNCDGILSMESFDANNNQELYRLKNVLPDYKSRNICVTYVLSKSDLYPTEEAKNAKMADLRQQLGLSDEDHLMECSSVTGHNVDKVMEVIVRQCLAMRLEKSKNQQEQAKSIKLELDSTSQQQSCLSCLGF